MDRWKRPMLQEAIDEYIASLALKEQGHSGANHNTIVAYRNDLNQVCAYLKRQLIDNWQQVTREHIAGYLLEMREGQAYRPTTIARKLGDFDAGQATIVCPGRNGRSKRARVLPLSAVAVEATKQYLAAARPRLVARHLEEQSLFLNHHGERLTRQGFWLIIKGYARQAGITEITPHMLRHSFAILMLQGGMELRSVQELLGHAHISTTQVYSQLAREGITTGV